MFKLLKSQTTTMSFQIFLGRPGRFEPFTKQHDLGQSTVLSRSFNAWRICIDTLTILYLVLCSNSTSIDQMQDPDRNIVLVNVVQMLEPSLLLLFVLLLYSCAPDGTSKPKPRCQMPYSTSGAHVTQNTCDSLKPLASF